MNSLLDKFRMVIWLAAGLGMYFMAALVGADAPAVQTVFYKMGHVTTLAWVGYWIARNALGRVTNSTPPTEKLARAVLIAGVIVAGSMGL